MSFHGGLLGVIIATILFAKKRQLSILTMGDILACITPVGLFLGRLANFVNGELYGRITYAVPWAVIFPNQTEPRHPSQLYEAATEGLLLFLILNAVWWFCPKYRRRSGFVAGLFFTLYGLFRMGMEIFRQPDAHIGFLPFQTTVGQWLCLPMVVLGLYLLYRSSPIYYLRKQKDEGR